MAGKISDPNDEKTHSIFNINLDFTDFIILRCNLSNNNCSFLVDSQADISVMKLSSLSNSFLYDTSDTIKIKGITNDTISSLGTVYIDLFTNDCVIKHKFHLVDDNFAIPTNGIIGKDFIKINRCCIDYDSMMFLVRLSEFDISIPIYSELAYGNSVLPARSEVFRLFHITGTQFPRVIQAQEISSKILIPTTIAYTNKTWIRVLNTNDENVEISTENLESQPITNFDIYLPDRDAKTQRSESLHNLLQTKIPQHASPDLMNLCLSYSDIFAMPGDSASVNNFYEQKLHFTDDSPVYVKNYRLPQSQKEEINKQVEQLLVNDLIELSQSSYNSPLLLVPKKSTDGTKKWRMCVDYRLLNKKLVPDKFPLPRIDEILDGLGNAKYFSVMDLQSGFHQIQLDQQSRKATAFSTDRGYFQWKVLPFGLSIAPSSFSRMMTLAFSGLTPEQAFIYMDDVIVLGSSEKRHLINLKQVFDTCRKYNLKLNPNKCEFLRHEVHFLGHKCTDKGLMPDPTKILAVKKYPRPTDKNAIRRFVAFANYYRRFIKNFAALAQPLTKLTGKRIDFKWTTEQETAFETLKDKLINPPILKYPDFTKDFTVTVDASQFACGAVLSQTFDGNDLPITFMSRSFKKGELNKPIIEKELLAIHFAVTSLRPYLYGRKFLVKSDHKPLIFLYNLKNPSSKLTRVRLELEEYDFIVQYIKGKDNVVADALSRISIDDLKELQIKNETENENVVLAMTRSMMSKMQNRNVQNESLNEHTKQKTLNEKVIEIFNAPFNKKVPRIKMTSMKNKNNELDEIEISAYKSHKILFKILVNEKLSLITILSRLQKAASDGNITELQWPVSDIFFKMCEIDSFKKACNEKLNNLKIYLTGAVKRVNEEVEKQQILETYHSDPLYGGHCGQKKLYAKLRSNFYWKNMTKDIAKFVKNCSKCQLNKPKQKNKEAMTITPTPRKPFDVLIVDTIGPLPKSEMNNLYAVTMMCDFSKYLVTVAIPNKEAKTIAKAIFENLILIFGPFRELRTDMGTEYKNEVITELCKLFTIKHNTSTAYHHESVGTIERNHRTFNEYLRAYISEKIAYWDTYLTYFTFCYNISKHGSFDYLYSPYELVFGRNVTLPEEFLTGRVDPIYNVENHVKTMKYILQHAHKMAVQLLEKMKMNNKKFFDKSAKPLNVQINDFVLVENQPYEKHKSKYSGPFRIIDIQGPNVILKSKNKTINIHKDRVRSAK